MCAVRRCVDRSSDSLEELEIVAQLRDVGDVSGGGDGGAGQGVLQLVEGSVHVVSLVTL